ncbi:MAG TPA: hypothetical protein VFO58_01295 [Vicinamibacterales bacterium]|nr:hypothetical protein [Vicinamibacterales bacterium]
MHRHDKVANSLQGTPRCIRDAALLKLTSGNFRRTTNDDLNPDAGVTEHGNQCVDAESIDLAPNEVADSRLRHAEDVRGLRLGQAAGFNHLAQANHQIGPDLEIRCLLG